MFVGKLFFFTYEKDIVQAPTGATAWSRVNQVVFISFLGDSFIFVRKRLYGDDESDRGSCPRNLFAAAKK